MHGATFRQATGCVSTLGTSFDGLCMLVLLSIITCWFRLGRFWWGDVHKKDIWGRTAGPHPPLKKTASQRYLRNEMHDMPRIGDKQRERILKPGAEAVGGHAARHGGCSIGIMAKQGHRGFCDEKVVIVTSSRKEFVYSIHLPWKHHPNTQWAFNRAVPKHHVYVICHSGFTGAARCTP